MTQRSKADYGDVRVETSSTHWSLAILINACDGVREKARSRDVIEVEENRFQKGTTLTKRRM